MTVQDLYKWARKNLKETVIRFSSTEAHTEITKELKTRFSESITIPGTLSAFIPNDNVQLQLKKISFATKFDPFPKKAVTPVVQKTQKNAKKQKRDEQLKLL